MCFMFVYAVKVVFIYNYVSPRRGIRFVLHAVSDRSLSLSLCHFLPSFWNNSATVREGVTKFEMPRQKLLNKCLFLFIAPFDLWPLPWHECANLCCDHDNWRTMAWIAPKFACRLSFTQGLDKFENQFGPTSTFKMAADLKKMACAIFPKMP